MPDDPRMKKIIFAAFFLVMTMPLFAQSEYGKLSGEAYKKSSLKINLISPFINTLSIFYTNYKDDESAFQFGLSFMGDFDYSGKTLNAQAFTLEYRYLLAGTHKLGPYVQPFLRCINAKSSLTSATVNYSESDFST